MKGEETGKFASPLELEIPKDKTIALTDLGEA